VVEELCSGAVVAALELELGIIKQGVDVSGADAGGLAQVLQIRGLVGGAELLDRGLVGEEGDDSVGVSLVVMMTWGRRREGERREKWLAEEEDKKKISAQ
jgi:hypothetical protein